MYDPIDIVNKKEKLLLVGPSCSGKNFILNKIINYGLIYHPKWTTRPKRDNEVQSQDYNFVSLDVFKTGINDNIFIEWESFFIENENSNKTEVFYGTNKEDFEKGQVFIFTPSAVNNLSSDIRKKCYVVYLDIDPTIRLERSKNRNDQNDKMIRRMKSDENDFKEFKNYDLKIPYPDFDVLDILGLMF
jgi:guanylate kinase